MASALRTADFLWLIPGLLSLSCAFLFQTERWRLLLGAQGIDLGWWRTLRVYLIGAFFNLFLLGATGGDIVKIYYAMRETSSKKAAALLSVLVDRMVGLMALVAVTAVLCSLRLDRLLADPLSRALLAALTLIMGGSLAVIVVGFCVERFHLAHKLPHWLPLRGRIVELSTAFSTYARDPRVLISAFALSVPAHLLIFLSFYFTARAFGVFSGVAGIDRYACRLARDPDHSLPSHQPFRDWGPRAVVPNGALRALWNAAKRGGDDIDHRFSHGRALGHCRGMRLPGLPSQRGTAP